MFRVSVELIGCILLQVCVPVYNNCSARLKPVECIVRLHSSSYVSSSNKPFRLSTHNLTH